MMNDRIKFVFKRKYAWDLIDMGFELVDTKIDKKSPMNMIYLFKDTQELREALGKLMNKDKRNK
ncbi:MAG: hypothetical protein MSA15_21035 [Clostridium sp.]|nr:hypothetical protein [Clostridium sp.]